MKNIRLLGYYNYTVILTYIGLASGVFGIFQAFENCHANAVVCLLISGFCDMFDGAIASTMKRTENEKNFGIQIDSLCDLVCFGVLPAVIVYSFGGTNTIDTAICILFVLCGLIRLAYFNVDEQERQTHSLERRKTYYGLPITFSALIIPMAFSLSILCNMHSNAIMHIIALITAILFITPFPVDKPGKVGKACFLLIGLIDIILVVIATIKYQSI